MKRDSLDSVIKRPEAMTSYLAHYGWHFSKKAMEYACKNMTKGGRQIFVVTRDDLDKLYAKHGVKVENNVMYDDVYAANMCRADYDGSAIEDERHLVLYVKDTIDDDDAADGELMRCWYAKMIARGVPVDWEELL